MDAQTPVTADTAVGNATVEAIATGRALQAKSAVTSGEAAERAAQAEAARSRAAQLIAEKRFAEARKALDEADALESTAERHEGRSAKILSSVRSKFRKKTTDSTVSEPVEAPSPSVEAAMAPVDKAVRIVSLYSKISIVAGILPTNVINFAAILAVQITMVWKIANAFGHQEGKERIRGSILSLVGSLLPTSLGHGLAYAVAAIPAVLTGVLVGVVVTPIIAYAMTQAVGNAFIMHFESGGTLLTFDPEKFREYFMKEFETARTAMKPA